MAKRSIKQIVKNKKQNSFSLTKDQQTAFEGIASIIKSKLNPVLRNNSLDSSMISLNGAAGTGKTFLIVELLKYFSADKNKIDCIVTAPTNKATGVIAQMLHKNSIGVKCKTIHSFLRIKKVRDYEIGKEKYALDEKNKHKRESTFLLIVDESSMINNEIFSYIKDAIKDGRVSIVLFVGDSYQLPPVNGTKNIISRLKNQFELKEIVRQAKDSYIIRVATKIRDMIENNEFVELDQFFSNLDEKEMQFFHNEKDFLNDYCENERYNFDKKIIASYTNKVVDRYNDTLRKRYWKEQGVEDVDSFREGDWVRFKESYEHQGTVLYFNGDEYKITSIEKSYHKKLAINFWKCNTISNYPFYVVDTKNVDVYETNLQEIANKAKITPRGLDKKRLWELFFKIKDFFAEVQYIYASTIHKLQGSTYEYVYIDLFSIINNSKNLNLEMIYRLIYVAITRASKDVRVLLPKSIFDNNTNENDQKDMDKYFNDKIKDIDSLLDDVLENLLKN